MGADTTVKKEHDRNPIKEDQKTPRHGKWRRKHWTPMGCMPRYYR